MKTPRKLKVLGIGAGSLLFLALVTVVVGYLSAPHFYLTRAIFWRESDYKDLHRFPVRTIHNAPPVSRFDKLPAHNPYASQIEAIGDRSANGSFENYLDSSGTTAFLVVHDDKLLYERYFNGYDERSLNTSFSMAKSFDSALVGIAIDEGYIKSVDEPITNYIPELLKKDRRFKTITIRNLLTMSSGIKYEEGGFLPWSETADDTKTYYATNLRELALNCQIDGKPGDYFEYNNYNPLLVGLILERATGVPVSRYMQEKLWKPLGMEADGSWSLDSKEDGFEKMESGVNARARDFARFGMLFAKEGNWRGKQLISREWVEESTRPDTSTDPSQDYQYFWWVNTPGGKNHFSAQGNYGQYIYVAPEKDLVIIRLGKEEGEKGYGYWTDLFDQLSTKLYISQKGSS
ncbi:MAG: beta-lactamase family protein [Actinomycetota bacterium]|nr:beta-lactamase family protein [Actinomycetota bacterium]